MHTGYIKLWRKTFSSAINKDSNAFHLAINLLLKAQWESGKYSLIWFGKQTYLKRGQVVFSRHSWAHELGMHPSVIRDALDRLCEKHHFCDKSSDSRKTIVTILNWDRYQVFDDGLTTDLATTGRQQDDTKQEYKNEKNDKEIPVDSSQNLKGLAPKVVKVTKETTTYEPVKPLEDCAPPPDEWFELKSRVRGGSI